ncbi:uncharacterized protein TrAFT101_001740 [Trichoderma asperellum]|uniref:uncharacterized protein n=1 Tax=Trichoderma asperellum TaxID=101201 RepID=UPI003321925D|nr:hypothetical protein TrAFT101_001740 [Trichoderma asperellum]
MPPARRAVLAAPVLATFGPKAHIPGFSELLRPLLACHLSSTPDSRSEATDMVSTNEGVMESFHKTTSNHASVHSFQKSWLDGQSIYQGVAGQAN